ncbi:hypothetical protein C8Q76DRAFT_471832 [Earliella scabrosa]|nr:hypothetical protein C8Q76DRAFT_471832 [Earliella scabrosa]
MPTRSRLPTELYEKVIDHTSEDDACSDFLGVCALVCRAWRPRSRIRFWRKVIIRSHDHFHRLLEACRAHSHIARNIYHLDIDISLSQSLGSGDRCLPLASLPILPHLQTLRLRGVPWRHYPPVYYRRIVSRFRPLTQLCLDRVTFHDMSDLFRLVWSFPCMSQLELRDLQFQHPPKEDAVNRVQRMYARRQPERCRDLERLVLESDMLSWRDAKTRFVFPVDALARSIRVVAIELRLRKLPSFSE